MSLYGVNLEHLQQAASVIRQHQLDLEGRILPDLRAALSQDLIVGNSAQAGEMAEAVAGIFEAIGAVLAAVAAIIALMAALAAALPSGEAPFHLWRP